MRFLHHIQTQLEEVYGAHTGLDVTDFVRPYSGKLRKGELLVEQSASASDINLALLLDRDILAAWESTQTQKKSEDFGVPFEEVSHFVYLAFNHNRGRNVTHLEMEIQAEVDRILMAYHGNVEISEQHREDLLKQLYEKPYSQKNYEEARTASANFIRNLSGGNPHAWTEEEFLLLRNFFHNDLSGKIRLSSRISQAK